MTATTATFKADRNWKAKFKLARKSTRAKAWNAQPMTNAEKRDVLTKARDLLSTNYGAGDWVQFIDDVEHFCMYGALEVVCGFAPDGSEFDTKVSACSLTRTLFDAMPETHRKKNAQREIDYIMKSEWRPLAEREAMSNRERVSALQHLNDSDGQERVLEVFDAAIESLG